VPLTSKLWTTNTKEDRHTDTIHAVGKAQSRSNCLSFDIVVGATIERGRQDSCIGGILHHALRSVPVGTLEAEPKAADQHRH